MPLLIRPAAPEDTDAIARIYNQGIAERGATFETDPRTPADIAARLADDERHPVLVAVEEGSVVGWAGLSAYRPRACYAGIAEFSIYLDRGMRGRGIGRVLLTALIAAAAARGYWKLVSRIFPFNAASRAICRSCGTWARAMRSGSFVQLSGRNSRRPTITGTSRDANVTETSDWQFAVFPSDEAYCGATPTD